MIEYGHNGLLVFLSLLVALVVGFTALSLTKDLSSKFFSQRKIAVALASFALGGGIAPAFFIPLRSVSNVLTGSDALTVLPYSVVYSLRRQNKLAALSVKIDHPDRNLGLL